MPLMMDIAHPYPPFPPIKAPWSSLFQTAKHYFACFAIFFVSGDKRYSSEAILKLLNANAVSNFRCYS